jgi:hypothetical protein
MFKDKMLFNNMGFLIEVLFLNGRFFLLVLNLLRRDGLLGMRRSLFG